ncbi:MAG TPA: ATP-binding protein [Sumerlaeia bacterium]|nr:ATP-binding protein [Sumerlaeia bacterium]
MPYFVVKTGEQANTVFPLAEEVATLGRNAMNNVVLGDSTVSRFHAKVIRREDQYCVCDLGSTHGTFVNDARATKELLLNDNDLVRLGETELVFHLKEPGAAQPEAPAVEREEAGAAAGEARGAGGPRDDVSTDSPGPAGEVADGVGGSESRADLAERAQVVAERIASRIPVIKGASDSGVFARGLPPKHAEMLSKVAEATQSLLDLDDLLETLMDTLFEILHADHGAILLFDETGEGLWPRLTRPAGEELRVSQTIIDRAVDDRMSVLVSDTAQDQRFSEAASVLAQSILSAICAPLVCKDRILGVLYIDTRSRWVIYQQEDLILLNIIAANAAIAIENAILMRQKLEAERLAAMGVAVAGISHYVKNILFGAQGSARLIEQGLESGDMSVVRKLWPILMRSNEKIASLVKDMLTYSKRREPEWRDGNVNSLLRDVYDGQLHRAEEAETQLLLQEDADLPDSRFDPSALHDAVLNIVGNAIEACEGRPEAQVMLSSIFSPDAETICIRVSDNGPGIPEEVHERVFEPFFSTKGSRGTGLGLALARKTVEEHGGRLLLESRPGAGATFKILLPFRPPEEHDSSAEG